MEFISAFLSSKKRYLFILSFVAALSLMLICGQARAQTHNNQISIIIPNDAPQYLDVVKRLENSLINKRETFKVINLSNFQQRLNVNLDKEKLVVLVGSKAFDHYIKVKAKSPFIVTLITKSAFNYFYRQSDNKKGFVGGVSIDQPVKRFIELTQALLPTLQKATMVLGPEKIKNKHMILKNIAEDDLNVKITEISVNDNPVNKLRNAYKSTQALILFPDRKKFNRSISRWVLTLSYQYKVPVISYSKKYATAGALASIFSTSKQIGSQTAGIMIPFLNNPNAKPKRLIDPKYFDIQINQSVARALNIRVPSKNELIKKISN